jgi:membrane protein DedA with SNARE-associated domain
MSFDLPGLIDTYGYWAVLLGAFLEGETILALAGLAAYRGYLDFYTVVAIAMVAGFAGDQFYFFLGRHRGYHILARYPDAQDRAHKFDAMLARWHAPLIIAIRFMYGFRIIGPVLLGMGRVPAWKFVVYNFIGAAIWAPLIAGLGYLFGSALETVLHDLKKVELWGLLFLVCCGAGGFAWHWWRARARARRGGDAGGGVP